MSATKRLGQWPSLGNATSPDNQLLPQEDARRLYSYLQDLEATAQQLSQRMQPPGQTADACTAAHMTAVCGIVRNGDLSTTKLSPADAPMMQKARHALQTYAEASSDDAVNDFFKEIDLGHVWPYCVTFSVFAQTATFFVTKGQGEQAGRMGMGPAGMQLGDVIVVLKGGNMPFVLRWLQIEADNGHTEERDLEGGRFELVGPAYVHGIMEGELVLGGFTTGPSWQSVHLR